jgi:hypothetical protein
VVGAKVDASLSTIGESTGFFEGRAFAFFSMVGIWLGTSSFGSVTKGAGAAGEFVVIVGEIQTGDRLGEFFSSRATQRIPPAHHAPLMLSVVDGFDSSRQLANVSSSFSHFLEPQLEHSFLREHKYHCIWLHDSPNPLEGKYPSMHA